ncbi:transposase protein domain-containing protein [Phthorimaea operculella]|nr:transposase protein domain-containing protein [Phthorimaea operculella]
MANPPNKEGLYCCGCHSTACFIASLAAPYVCVRKVVQFHEYLDLLSACYTLSVTSDRNLMKKWIENLSHLLNELKEKRFINQEQADLLESCGISAAALIKRMRHRGKEYSPELRTFALTLYFYSPKAYCYIRSSFNTCLPHPTTIRKWYQCINATPGFTTEAFKVLEQKVKSTENKVLCNLVLDEMSIRQLKEYDGNSVQGYVDFGTTIEMPEDTAELCTQALVFLLVAINDKWKMPVAYFLVNGVTGEQRANLVRMCLSNCHDISVEVASMTFDGCPANIAMARELGCTFDIQAGLQTCFPHPETGRPVYVFFNPCHMVKLVSNSLQSQKILCDNNGGLIKWQYFTELNTLQVNENFHLASKLTTRHIDFKSQIMKVKLAVQLMSASVAKAIEF